MTGRPISRRRALQLAGLGTIGVAVGVGGWVAHLGDSSQSATPGATGESLVEPSVHTSAGGLLTVRLTAAPGVRLAGRHTSALGYTGSSPGPTLRVHPGDLLRIHLTNNLDQPTNLHTHGLHVSPLGNSDNPFISVEPGASFDYAYRIPRDHPPGTLWYHPHHHGHVADQIFGGLAGALIVDGDHATPAAAERILVITDTTIDEDGRVADSSAMAKMMGREGRWVLVNGQLSPTLRANAGSIQRWRLINACTSRVLSLRLENHRLTRLSVDGSTLPTPRVVDRLVLAPGNRGDVLVRPAAAGQHRLITDPYNRGSVGMGMDGASSTTRSVALATMTVAGTGGGAATVSPEPPAPAIPVGPIAATRQLTFAMDMGSNGMGGMGGIGARGTAFTIDGRTFDPNRTDQTPRLGTIEDWLITNISPMDHPFHLHVWPFQVLQDSTGSTPDAVPQDVVLVPAQGWTRIRVHFADYPGRSVYHCHILDHEDAGMMGTVQVSA